MKVTQTQSDSARTLMDEFYKFADAGAALIHVRTRETLRCALTLRKHLLSDNNPYLEWDVTNGFRSAFTTENFVDHTVSGNKDDFTVALEKPMNELRNATSEVHRNKDKIHFFVYINPQPFIANNPYVQELIQQYAAVLPSTNICLIFITPDMPLPDIPVGTVLTTQLNTPSVEELEAVLSRIINDSTSAENGSAFPQGHDITAEEQRQIALLGLGLTNNEFETSTALAVLEAPLSGAKKLSAEHLLAGIAKGKTEVVRQSEILELMPTASLEDVAGMQRLKDWVAMRSKCFSDEAKEFGIEPPKGIVLVGVPGVGKSLAAKATASALGVPLVKLDFGRVFSKYVGDSESRVRSALKMVEGMAPCVLFVDEVDKGLGGAGGGGDSGTSSRVLGSFLTWLQECQAPVFTMLTANRVDGLPPELLRRGRFDGIFAAGMPGDDMRKETLAIHLRKRGHDIATFDDAEVAKFLTASKGYVPAEIESAVKDALVSAFTDDTGELSMGHILKALEDMVPMSKAFADKISAIENWAAQNATSVEYGDDAPAPAKNNSTGRRIRLAQPLPAFTPPARRTRPARGG